MHIIKHEIYTGALLTAYLHNDSPEMPDTVCRKRAAIIICPGGAYRFTSGREHDAPAMAFLNMGLQVFVLSYSVGSLAKGKQPLEELARSILWVRTNCVDLLVDPEKITVMGFSAGGHLAASLGVHWDDTEILSRCNILNADILRPNALVLCYPVISMGKFTHIESRNYVTGDVPDPSNYWSLETQVKPNTPPVFIWHTVEDDVVPIENSFLFAQSLHQAGVSYECHFFAKGGHGMSVCSREVGIAPNPAATWVRLCREWLETQFGYLGGCC